MNASSQNSTQPDIVAAMSGIRAHDNPLWSQQ